MITRLNFSYVVNRLSHFLANTRVPHFKAVQRVLQYVKATPRQGFFFPSNIDVHLKAYVEANLPFVVDVQFKVFSGVDWATCPNTRCSIT